MPNAVIYPVILREVERFGTSQKDLERKAAIRVLGWICDSTCLDSIKEDIGKISTFVVGKLQDQSFVVREAAAEAVGKFSEHVVPDFLELHAQVMPSLILVLRELKPSAHDMTLQKGLFALTEFTNNLSDDIKIYLAELVTLLLNFVDHHEYSRDVRYWALMALGSVVSSAEKKILPYQETILKSLFATINNDSSTEAQVRG